MLQLVFLIMPFQFKGEEWDHVEGKMKATCLRVKISLLSNNPKFFVAQEVLTHKNKSHTIHGGCHGNNIINKGCHGNIMMVVAMVTLGLDYSIIHL